MHLRYKKHNMKTTNEQIRPVTQNSSTYHRLTNNTNNNALTQHVLDDKLTYYIRKYKCLKTNDFLVRLYWYLGKLKDCPLGRKDICSWELFFSSTWTSHWLVHTTRENNCSSDCSKSSEKVSSESVNPYRLALRKTLFIRPTLYIYDVCSKTDGGQLSLKHHVLHRRVLVGGQL